jgi:hypothetical protein
MGKNKRKNSRLEMTVSGRYMLANRQDYPCTVVDVSSSGLVLVGPEQGTLGERVVVYIDDNIGRVEGDIVRHVPGGFAMDFHLPSRTAAALGRLVTLVEQKLRPDAPVE